MHKLVLLQLEERQHFVDSSDMYSLQDLLDTAEDLLLPQLTKIHSSFAQHIKTDCQVRLLTLSCTYFISNEMDLNEMKNLITCINLNSVNLLGFFSSR